MTIYTNDFSYLSKKAKQEKQRKINVYSIIGFVSIVGISIMILRSIIGA